MPNIADSLQCSSFLTKLRSAERNIESLSDWERDFVENLRTQFEGREDAEDFGLTPWNPSVSQWNTLAEIVEKYQ